MKHYLRRTGRYVILVLTLTAMAAVAWLLLTRPRHQVTWNIETVDNTGAVGAFSSLALDSAGNPHICYWDKTKLAPKYAAWDGSNWNIQIVDGGPGYPSREAYASLAVDSVGNPHISYCDSVIGDLKYAVRDMQSWSIETLPGVSSMGRYIAGTYSSLVLDSVGNPHISCLLDFRYERKDEYHIPRHFDLVYAAWDGTAWHIQVVDSAGDVGRYSSLALDTAGHPHIAYWDWTNAALKYATWDGTVWHIQTVDSTGDVGRCSSLALDTAGNPHISYWDWTNTALKYATWDGSAWHIQTVDSTGDIGDGSSLALDSRDRPHISYFDGTNGDLKYASWDDLSWHIQTVDSAGDVGRFGTSLALDSADNPHISYCDWTNTALKYATWVGSTRNAKAGDNADHAGSETSLAVDPAPPLAAGTNLENEDHLDGVQHE